MASSASLVALVAALVIVPPPPVPAALEQRVAQAVGERWGEPAARLTLEWGAIASPVADARVPFRLVGRGESGQFVVVFEPAVGAPVAVTLRVAARERVPVAARPLAARQVLMPGDIVDGERLRWGPPERAATAVPAEGWTLRRALAAGDPLTGNAVPPELVRAGEAVSAEWRSGAVAVVLAATAISGGGEGDVIRLRVAGRATNLSGRVRGPGLVELMP